MLRKETNTGSATKMAAIANESVAYMKSDSVPIQPHWAVRSCLSPSTVQDHSLNGVRSILNGFFPLVTRAIAISSSNSSSKLRNGH